MIGVDGVPDVDSAGLGTLVEGDSECEYAVVVFGVDVFDVEDVAEHEPP